MQIIWSLQDFKGDKGKAIKVPLAILFGRGMYEIAYKYPSAFFSKPEKCFQRTTTFQNRKFVFTQIDLSQKHRLVEKMLDLRLFQVWILLITTVQT